MNKFRMIILIDPPDDPSQIEIILTLNCVEDEQLQRFTSVCAQINRDGIIDSTTNIWYPPYQIRRIKYEGYIPTTS